MAIENLHISINSTKPFFQKKFGAAWEFFAFIYKKEKNTKKCKKGNGYFYNIVAK